VDASQDSQRILGEFLPRSIAQGPRQTMADASARVPRPRVPESAPLAPLPSKLGERPMGLADTALLRRPRGVDPHTWLARWHIDHPTVARGHRPGRRNAACAGGQRRFPRGRRDHARGVRGSVRHRHLQRGLSRVSRRRTHPDPLRAGVAQGHQGGCPCRIRTPKCHPALPGLAVITRKAQGTVQTPSCAPQTTPKSVPVRSARTIGYVANSRPVDRQAARRSTPRTPTPTGPPRPVQER
jgi:hypothetical protein